MSENSQIIKVINSTIDQNDPTQKAISLLAILVEERFSQMSETIKSMNNRIDDNQKDIENLHNNCPLHLDKKIEKIEGAIQPITFVNNYPKLGIILLIGFITLCGMGIERLIDLLK